MRQVTVKYVERVAQPALAIDQGGIGSPANVGAGFGQNVQQAAGARLLADLERLRRSLRGHQTIDVKLVEILFRGQERGAQPRVEKPGSHRFEALYRRMDLFAGCRQIAAVSFRPCQDQADLSFASPVSTRPCQRERSCELLPGRAPIPELSVRSAQGIERVHLAFGETSGQEESLAGALHGAVWLVELDVQERAAGQSRSLGFRIVDLSPDRERLIESLSSFLEPFQTPERVSEIDECPGLVDGVSRLLDQRKTIAQVLDGRFPVAEGKVGVSQVVERRGFRVAVLGGPRQLQGLLLVSQGFLGLLQLLISEGQIEEIARLDVLIVALARLLQRFGEGFDPSPELPLITVEEAEVVQAHGLIADVPRLAGDCEGFLVPLPRLVRTSELFQQPAHAVEGPDLKIARLTVRLGSPERRGRLEVRQRLLGGARELGAADAQEVEGLRLAPGLPQLVPERNGTLDGPDLPPQCLLVLSGLLVGLPEGLHGFRPDPVLVARRPGPLDTQPVSSRRRFLLSAHHLDSIESGDGSHRRQILV